jgi:hypothetical protein
MPVSKSQIGKRIIEKIDVVYTVPIDGKDKNTQKNTT